MPLIPPDLLATLKRDVSCRSVLESSGAVFTKHGADVVCRCPFHDDRTPSLVVNERKNLWKCHGACGVGGDVIALTVKLRGISFRHAVEALADGLPGGASSFAALPAAGASGPAKPPRHASARSLPCPLDAGASDARLMDQVVAYYAARLAQPGNAGRAYLASRGLDDGDLIRRFALGYADRSLGLRLPNKQRKEGADLRARLERLGLFRASGHEHFAGSVVWPLHGDDGAVVGMYGRKVIPNLRVGTPRHTYLAGSHRGVWNLGPGLVDGNGRVVVAEAVIDAASAWCAGVRNVTAAYGVNGWTEHHTAALRAQGARDVVLAFDADAAGDAGASALADRLIGDGFTLYRAHLPPGQDLNDVWCQTRVTEPGTIAALVANAAWLGGAPRVTVPTLPPLPPASLTLPDPRPASAPGEMPAPEISSFVAPPIPALPAGVVLSDGGEGQDITVTMGTRVWRVRGLERNRSVDALKVHLRVTVATAQGDRFHLDTLDVYQSRLRSAFIGAAFQETGLSVDCLRTDVGHLLLALEQVQYARQAAATAAAAATVAAAGPGNGPGGAADPAASLTPEERADALALLQRPDLLDVIVADLGTCGLVGETANKRAAILACVSRLTPSPLALLVQSTSAAGKTTVMDAVVGFLPPTAVRRYSAISGKSPFYLGADGGLKHRVLAIAEEEGARRASYALKLLQSDGYLSMAATGKDPATGRLVTYDYRVEGPVMLFLTTTAIDLDPELVNRCLVLTVDESPEQTAAIHAAQREARTLAGLAARDARARLRLRHQHAQALLRPYPVIIPDAPRLRFAVSSSRLRRDQAKFLDLITAVTLLHQCQRPVRTTTLSTGERLDYLEATPGDIATAADIAAAVLGRCLDDLPPQTRRLWDGLRAFVVAQASAQGLTTDRVRFTRRQAQQALGWSYGQVRIHLDRLVQQDYVLTSASGPGRIAEYALVPGIDDDAPASPVLPMQTAPPDAAPDVGMTTTLQGVCRGLAGVVGANSSSDEMRDIHTEYGTLQGLGVCTGGPALEGGLHHIMDGIPVDGLALAGTPAAGAA